MVFAPSFSNITKALPIYIHYVLFGWETHNIQLSRLYDTKLNFPHTNYNLLSISEVSFAARIFTRVAYSRPCGISIMIVYGIFC